MAQEVEDWKHGEAQLLNGASSELRRIATELEQNLTGLSEINRQIYGDQVAGPPAELMLSKWQGWKSQADPLVARLYALSGDLSRVASNWEQSYQQQVRESEDAKNQGNGK
jgi:hypothetical protein